MSETKEIKCHQCKRDILPGEQVWKFFDLTLQTTVWVCYDVCTEPEDEPESVPEASQLELPHVADVDPDDLVQKCHDCGHIIPKGVLSIRVDSDFGYFYTHVHPCPESADALKLAPESDNIKLW
jgi:hypothetical protein